MVYPYGRWGAGRLDVIPGSFELTTICILNNKTDIDRANHMFATSSRCAMAFDYIFLDLNPGVSHLTFSALRNIDLLLCPTRDDKFSPIGLRLIRDFIENYFPEKHAEYPNYYSVVMNASPDPRKRRRPLSKLKLLPSRRGRGRRDPSAPTGYVSSSQLPQYARRLHVRPAPFLVTAAKKASLVEDFKQLAQGICWRANR